MSALLPASGTAPFSRAGWIAALVGAAVLVALVVAPPWIGLGPRLLVMEAFSYLCHQMPSRSFHADGVAFAACHRCTGIYAGLLVGAVLFPLVRGSLKQGLRPALLASGTVMAVDWALGVTGIWANTVFTQTATGLLFGIAAGWAVTLGLAGDGEADSYAGASSPGAGP